MAMKRLHRSACLTNYVEVAQSLHVSPLEQLRRVDINPACLTNPDTRDSGRRALSVAGKLRAGGWRR